MPRVEIGRPWVLDHYTHVFHLFYRDAVQKKTGFILREVGRKNEKKSHFGTLLKCSKIKINLFSILINIYFLNG